MEVVIYLVVVDFFGEEKEKDEISTEQTVTEYQFFESVVEYMR